MTLRQLFLGWAVGLWALAASCGGKAIVDGRPGSGGAGVTSSAGTTTGAGSCKTDADCRFGEAWCTGGTCQACDNGGLACDLACQDGWQMYSRNGCHPCSCAPVNQCQSDAECGDGLHCYAGKFCWDWCPKGDPSCCYGNLCDAQGCPEPPPTGCFKTGCAAGLHCVDSGCASSSCKCVSLTWSCSKDCGGGTCVM
jgi:hypothetical protein